MHRMTQKRNNTFSVLLITAMALPLAIRAETISVVVTSNAAPRVEFGAEQLSKALKAVKLDAVLLHTKVPGGRQIIIGEGAENGLSPESFSLKSLDGDSISIAGGDDSGVLYGCLELARQIRQAGRLPRDLNFVDAPVMKLRGTCVGLQKTYILPGRRVYEYPITPELFPWFYDKKLWTEYLDFLAANRMNTLYLWSGHPFASLVRLKDYPYAVEVPNDVFLKNQEMYRWLARECDRRGIWLVQMFYNILVSKPFAETNHISTQLSAPTPLVSDYTRQSIAKFVKDYPNVGLLVCLGEALRGTANQLEWCTNVILPGVREGMKEAGLETAGQRSSHASGHEPPRPAYRQCPHPVESRAVPLRRRGVHQEVRPGSARPAGRHGHSFVSVVVLELAVCAGPDRSAAVPVAARLDLV